MKERIQASLIYDSKDLEKYFKHGVDTVGLLMEAEFGQTGGMN